MHFIKTTSHMWIYNKQDFLSKKQKSAECLIEYRWSWTSSLQSFNNFRKRWSCIWILIPAIFDQRSIPFRTSVWNRQSLFMCVHHHCYLSVTLSNHVYLHWLHAIIRNLPCQQLPEIDSVWIHICLFCVNMASYHLRCHPLVCAALSCHHAMRSCRLFVTPSNETHLEPR